MPRYYCRECRTQLVAVEAKSKRIRGSKIVVLSVFTCPKCHIRWSLDRVTMVWAGVRP